MDELNLELLEELEEFGYSDENGKKEFVINNDITADRVIRKIKHKQDEYERMKNLADAEIADIQDKISKEKKKLDTSKSFYLWKLQDYFETVETKKTKTKATYKLLSGSLVKKLSTQQINHDDDSLLAYLKLNGLNEYIETKEIVKWKDFKKRLKTSVEIKDDPETGEIISERTFMIDQNGKEVDGITVNMTEESFDVKF